MRSKIRKEQVFDVDFVSPEEHEGLHDRDTYIEVTRLQGKVSQIDEWRTILKTHKVSSTAIIRFDNIVIRTEKIIYDYVTGSGVIATITGTIMRDNGQVVAVEYERDNDMEGI